MSSHKGSIVSQYVKIDPSIFAFLLFPSSSDLGIFFFILVPLPVYIFSHFVLSFFSQCHASFNQWKSPFLLSGLIFSTLFLLPTTSTFFVFNFFFLLSFFLFSWIKNTHILIFHQEKEEEKTCAVKIECQAMYLTANTGRKRTRSENRTRRIFRKEITAEMGKKKWSINKIKMICNISGRLCGDGDR